MNLKSREDRRRIACWLLAVAHTAALAIVYVPLTFGAFFRFNTSWDYLAYHLPSSLSRFGLTTYLPIESLQEVIAGSPPLAHLVQGGLVYLTGRLTAANGQNAVAFFFVMLILKSLLGPRLPMRWFATGCLTIPLFVLHFNSGMIDLFNGCSLLLTMGAMVAFSLRRDKWSAIAVVAGFLACSLSKLQGWPVAAVFLVGFAVQIVWLVREGSVQRRFAAAIFLAALLAFAVWPLRNIIRYSNPTYPFRPPIIGHFISRFENPISQEGLNREVPGYLQDNSLAYRFVTSVLELNRRFAEFPYHWSLDGGQMLGSESPHQRMGGYFPVSVFLLAALTLLGLARGALPKIPVATFVASVGFVMCALPANHELRYWLYMPLCLALFASLSIAGRKDDDLLISKGVLLALAYFVSVTLGAVEVRGFVEVEDTSPEEAKIFWEEHKGSTETFKVCNKMPFSIFWAGPDFNTFRIAECATEPDSQTSG